MLLWRSAAPVLLEATDHPLATFGSEAAGEGLGVDVSDGAPCLVLELRVHTARALEPHEVVQHAQRHLGYGKHQVARKPLRRVAWG